VLGCSSSALLCRCGRGGLRGHSILGPWRKSDSIPTASTGLHFPTKSLMGEARPGNSIIGRMSWKWQSQAVVVAAANVLGGE
jgi:hypothetical protein